MKINKVILNAIVATIVALVLFPVTGMKVDAAEVFIDCGNGRPEGKTFDNFPMILMPGETLTYYKDERKEDIVTTVTTEDGIKTIKLGERTSRPGGFVVTEGGGLVATTEGEALVLRGGKEGDIESYSVIPITSIRVKDVPVLVSAAPLPTDKIGSMQVTNDMGVVTSQDSLCYCSVKVEGLPAAGYEIQYDLDGGSWSTGGQGPSFIKVTKERQEIDSEDPIKPGYGFGGYKITSGHTGSAITIRGGDIIVEELKVGSNWESAKNAMNRGTVKLKADWYPEYYDCYFDANGGTISGSKPSYITIENYESKFLEVSAKKDDDIFIGWVCNGKLIKSEEDFKSIFIDPTLYEIKFKAKWQSEATPCEMGNHDFKRTVSNGDDTHKILCMNCDAVQNGHDKDICTYDAGTVTKQPTATETGVKTYTCTKCGNTKTETVAKLTLKDQKITTAKIKAVKAKTLKKKSATIKLKAKTDGNGKLTYKVTSTPKKMKKFISVSKKGVVTLKKNAKKGTYKITITAAENGSYKMTTKVITIKVK